MCRMMRTCTHVSTFRSVTKYDRAVPEPATRTEKPRSRGRVPWGTITREQVVDAAAKAVHDGRYEEMTIRSLAADLGVGPMSLYRHVRDKDDLLIEVTDRLLAASWKPRVSRSDWQAWIADAAGRLRKLLVAQPGSLEVYLRRPVVSPAAMARMEAMLDVLRDAGFDEPSARRAYGAVHTYTIGFAALQASRNQSAHDEDTDAMVKQLATFTTPRQFSEGLSFLLDGISSSAG
jgi:TetR/AcrR family tetracycline transcriptional repressor